MGTSLRYEDYTVAWIAVLPIEAEAAIGMLDRQHQGRFESTPGDDYVYIGGEANGHNVVIATWSAGHEYGIGAASALAAQIKARFSNIWFTLLTGIAAGLPNLSAQDPTRRRDIRLGDVLVCVADQGAGGIIHYDLGKHTNSGFHLLGRQTETPGIVRAAIGNIQLTQNRPYKTGSEFARYVDKVQQSFDNEKFKCPNQDRDVLFDSAGGASTQRAPVQRDCRDESERTRVWYGNIGSGNSLMRNSQRRDVLRDKYNLIGLEMEAAGVMQVLPAGIIRGVCDYGDEKKNDEWQPYAAVVAAAYAKGILYTIQPKKVLPNSKPRMISRRSIFTVPYGRDIHYIPRLAISSNLEERIHDCGVATLCGLGGTGKSQIAIEYAYDFHAQHPQAHVLWIYAATIQSIFRAYQDLARRLRLPGFENPKADVFQLMKEWFDDSEEDDGNTKEWLLVLDNIDDNRVLDMALDEDYSATNNVLATSRTLRSYLPRRFSCNRVLMITTRNGDIADLLGQGEERLLVDHFTPAESRILMRDRLLHLKPGSDNDSDIDQLAHRLTYIPLAIAQAVAFINRNKVSILRFLQILGKDEFQQAELLSTELQDPRREPGYPNSVFQTWKISFERIKTEQPATADLLSTLAIFHPQQIPKWLLKSIGLSDIQLSMSLGTLSGYSLIAQQVDEDFISLHPLVRASLRYWLRHTQCYDRYADQALASVSEEFPEGYFENWEKCKMLMPHAVTILDEHVAHSQNLTQLENLSYNMALYEQLCGRYTQAYSYLQQPSRVLDLSEDTDSLPLLKRMHLKALILESQGKYGQSEEINREVLAASLEVLGMDHVDTLTSMSNLALVLYHQGKVEQAEEMNRQVLALAEKVLGLDHGNTIMIRNNLALSLTRQAKYQQAEEMYRRSLEDIERIYGTSHPDTMKIMYNLASVLQDQGKYREAEELSRRAFTGYEKLFGIDHPETLSSMTNLAKILQNQGKYEEAEELNLRALTETEKVLGPYNPVTLQSMSNLGLVLQYQGKYEQAEDLLRRSLTGYHTALGNDHANTLTGMSNLALNLQYQRKYEEAEEMNRSALAGLEKTLGIDHPTTLSSVNCLADLFHRQEKYDLAIPLYQRAVAGLTNALGPNHPKTLVCKGNQDSMMWKITP